MTTAPDTRDMSGLALLQSFLAAGTRPPMIEHMDFALVEIEPGRAVFEGEPKATMLNPMGSVHGGYAATILDTACGCAVHAHLAAGQSFTTLELKVSYLRGLSAQSGRVRAEGRTISIGKRVAFAEATLTDDQGRICATATSTLMVFGTT
ncbi:PaaI family thioesterase [Novosphingobium olei]|uniref:PaaI family thioesterase n=1 Tax=Novosphingobium olei TaxID=2728851 RepID=UPI003091E3FD|nr:PaaI family thioesterase [Novosphingobium olei]